VKPILQALLIADHVYQDKVTGKKIVAGIFRNLYYQTSPPQPSSEPGEGNQQSKIVRVAAGGQRAGSPFCYISLTEVHGEQEFELRYVDLHDDKPLIQTTFSVNASSPVDTVEAIIPLPALPVGKAGTFSFELLWHNEPIGAHRIQVTEIKPEGHPDGK
jgi:Family of unknown function (DUF6941)